MEEYNEELNKPIRQYAYKVCELDLNPENDLNKLGFNGI